MAPIVTHILPYEGDVIVLKNSVSTVFKLSSSLAKLRGEMRGEGRGEDWIVKHCECGGVEDGGDWTRVSVLTWHLVS